MGKEQTGLLAALWHYMSEHFCVPVFTHFACRYYTSRQELASQEPLPGHSPLFELGPAIQRLGLRCMPLAPTPFQMTTTTTTIPTTKNITTVTVTKNTSTTTTTNTKTQARQPKIHFPMTISPTSIQRQEWGNLFLFERQDNHEKGRT